MVSSKDLLTVSRLWALDIAEGRKTHTNTLQRTDKIEPIHESSAILVKRQEVLKTSRSMSHYKACLDVIEEGIISGGYAGVLKVKFITCNIKFCLSMQKLIASMQVQVYVLSHFYCPLLSKAPENRLSAL